MKVTGHGDQSERRNDGTQPNARRDSWSKTEDHDVIGRIKTIELRNKLQPEFTRMADSYLDGVWCRLFNTDFCIVGYSENAKKDEIDGAGNLRQVRRNFCIAFTD